MKVYYPGYYHSFSCIAAACEDSCCKEWAVDLDPETARYYRNLEGELGQRLRAVLQDTESGAEMVLENGRCPMWREDGLCRIQAELGHDALCKTCREFPRLRHDYGSFAELGLELSCPEAARLILNASDYKLCVREAPGGEAPDYDTEVMDILRAGREEMLRFLENSAYSLPQTLAIFLLHSHGIQGQIDGGEAVEFDPEACLADARRYAGPGDPEALFSFYQGLTILTDNWRKQLERGPVSPAWNKYILAFARYAIGRFYLQAVSDFDLVCRAKLVVAGCWMLSALGGDTIQTAQLYAKEIENDPDNVEAILSGAYTAPALTDANLLGLLLG